MALSVSRLADGQQCAGLRGRVAGNLRRNSRGFADFLAQSPWRVSRYSLRRDKFLDRSGDEAEWPESSGWLGFC